MPYTLNKFDGTSLVTIADGVVDKQDTTSINFIGKNVSDYGTLQNDNFLWLLENFSAPTAPVHKLQGQLWFDKTTGVLRPKIYDGAYWRMVGITEISDTEPTYLQTGDLWFDSTNKQLWAKNSTGFTLVGPELVKGYDNTKWESISVSSADSAYPVIALAVNGIYLALISSADFDVVNTDAVYALGFTHLYKGITFKDSTVSLHGNVEDSRYGKLVEDDIVTGNWKFTNQKGIIVGSDGGTKFYNTSGDTVIQNTVGGSVVINAQSLSPISSNINLGSNANKFGSVYATTFNAGTNLTAGNFTGDFSLTPSSKLHPSVDLGNSLGQANSRWNSVYTTQVSAGSSATVGLLEGQWTLTANSKIISPVVQTPVVSAGATSANGTFVGQWIAAPGSTIQATSVVDSSGNVLPSDYNPTRNTIAQRGTVGDIKATTFIGNLTGNVTGNTSGTHTGAVTGDVTGNTNGTHTGPVTGDVTGNVTGNVNGNLTGNVLSQYITAGSPTTDADILGVWKFSTDSKLKVNYISAGNNSDQAQFNGSFVLTSGSRLQATDILDNYGQIIPISDQAGNGSLVRRTGAGVVNAGTFQGNLTGNVTGNVSGDAGGNAATATKLKTSRKISLSGDVSGNVNFDGTQDVTITATIASPIPRGIIVMWSGAVNATPAGWHICDGTNGTPDLRDRFVVGAGNSYSVGEFGGEASHTLSAGELPSHRHTLKDVWQVQSDGPTNFTSLDGSSGWPARNINGVFDTGTVQNNPSYGGYMSIVYDNGGDGGINDNAIWYIDNATDYTGSGQAHENRPPYYALAYIMKL